MNVLVRIHRAYLFMGDLGRRASVPRIAACNCIAALYRMMFRTRSHGRSDASTRSVIPLSLWRQTIFDGLGRSHVPTSSGCDLLPRQATPRSRSQWRRSTFHPATHTHSTDGSTGSACLLCGIRFAPIALDPVQLIHKSCGMTSCPCGRIPAA